MTGIEGYIDQIRDGEQLSFEQALDIVNNIEPVDIYRAADNLRKEVQGDSFDLCSIINAKAGKCSENCRFCAQSSRYQTEVETYDMVSEQEVLRQGQENDSYGVARFSLVTAGRDVSVEDLKKYGDMYRHLAQKTDLYFCASMGFLTREKAKILYDCGVRRYHCNLETCRSYFPQVCTTHTWEQKVETIDIAREAGMEICSGGIIGMGESLEQRLELAFELRQLEVYSIPINLLTPIAGTPFENMTPLPLSDVLTAIAMFRLINPRAVVRLAGGRAQYENDQYKFFLAGANGAIVGNYLTTAGNNIEEDLEMIRSLGFTPPPRDTR